MAACGNLVPCLVEIPSGTGTSGTVATGSRDPEFCATARIPLSQSLWSKSGDAGDPQHLYAHFARQ